MMYKATGRRSGFQHKQNKALLILVAAHLVYSPTAGSNSNAHPQQNGLIAQDEVEYYAAVKKNGLLPCTRTWMKCREIVS